MIQEFTSEMKSMMNDIIGGVHTAIPGKVVSFDADDCTASILPVGAYRKPDGSTIPFPQLSGVPVYILQGAGQKATIAFPVKPGDECLILFSEQSLESWRTGAEAKVDLGFDLSNAIALIGLFAKPNPLVKEAVSKDAIVIDRNGTRIALLPGNSVEITGNVTVKGNLSVSGNSSVTGSETVGGAITSGGSIVASGLNLNTHTHTSGQAGSSTSGPS